MFLKRKKQYNIFMQTNNAFHNHFLLAEIFSAPSWTKESSLL